MAERAIIDMTGRNGLTNKWGGDNYKSGYVGYLQNGQPNLRYNSGESQVVSGTYNPIVKYGFLSPAPKTSNVVLTINKDTNSSLVDDINKRIYFASNKNTLYYKEYDYNGAAWNSLSLDTNDFLRVTDMAMYYLNGERTVFLTGKVTGSQNRVKTFKATGTTPVINSDWSYNDVAGAFQLPESYASKFIVSGDGYMYLLNKNAVHRIDGTVIGGVNGSIAKDILVGPFETYLTHGVEYNNYLYIVVQKNTGWEKTTGTQRPQSISTTKGNVGVYVWNRQSTFYNSSNFIEIPGISYVTNMFVTPKNELYVMAVSPTSEVLILKFNGSRFTIVKQMPFGAQPTCEHSLKTYGQFNYWSASDGYIYMFGSELPGEEDSLYRIGQYNDGGVGNSRGISINIVSEGSLTLQSGIKTSTDVLYMAGEFDLAEFKVKQFFINPYDKITF